MTANRPLRVFLCHSSNDKPAVRELYQKLCAEAWIHPWLDEEELYPGQNWNFEIEKAVEAADVIIVCLSKGSTTKEGYVQREIRVALDYAEYKPESTLYIIPVRLEECEPPHRLRVWQYADYFEGQRERGFQRLLVSLKRRADGLGLIFGEPAPKTEETPVIERQIAEKTLQPVSDSQAKLEEKKPVIGPPKPIPVATSPNKITLSNGMEFMRVPAGKFLMGSKANYLASDGEKPQHNVDIPYDYWMVRFPITNELYNAYVKSKGSKHPGSDWEKKSDHPVVNISWKNAMAYCGWLNDVIKNELPSSLVLRLPTEAEWEKAARGTDEREYPWGDEFDKNKCNTSEGGKGNTTSAGFYSPGGDSPYGCADMAGNVWEWTHSLMKKYPYKVDDGREDERASGTRVLRGGSFNNNWGDARCACRYDLVINYIYRRNGFRVVVAPAISK